MNQEEIRTTRARFGRWAREKGMNVGRDEGGYYDDDEEGSKAWRVWLAAKTDPGMADQFST